LLQQLELITLTNAGEGFGESIQKQWSIWVINTRQHIISLEWDGGESSRRAQHNCFVKRAGSWISACFTTPSCVILDMLLYLFKSSHL
jgi:hypothetical protein